MNDNLKLQHFAIGSLPFDNIDEAMNIVRNIFPEIPFFPQLSRVQKSEDMIIQVLEGFPSFCPEKISDFAIDSESDLFYSELETFYSDCDEIFNGNNTDLLDKYKISSNFSSTFDEFIRIIKQTRPEYAKGQVVGPFTLASAITDINSQSIVFDETLRDIVVQLLKLKVLWQIRQIKKANNTTVPIIFMDEPTLSQLGTSAYLGIDTDDVTKMIKEISDCIRQNGGLSAIHCCGKCDWSLPISADVNIINVDAYSFGKHFGLYSELIEGFLKEGGKIAWGIIPTLDSNALSKITCPDLIKIFEKSVTYLTNKGINEKLITDNSMITCSCGAGSLSPELAHKAMNLVKELSEELKKRY